MTAEGFSMGGAPKRHGRAYPRDYTGSPKETFQLALIKPLSYAFLMLFLHLKNKK